MQESLFAGQLTPETALHPPKWLWTILAAVWLLMAFTTKRTKRRETVLERIRHILPLVIGFWLFFGKTFYLPLLHFRLLPNLPSIWSTGLFLTGLGVGFALWARLSLGSNWSGTVTLKDNHELIRKGLYSRVRHPIYSGILLGVIGTGMIHGQLRDLLVFLLLRPVSISKPSAKQSFFQQEFGPNFAEHQRQTGTSFPKFDRRATVSPNCSLDFPILRLRPNELQGAYPWFFKGGLRRSHGTRFPLLWFSLIQTLSPVRQNPPFRVSYR